jgi:hypothetical protein
MHDSSLCSVRRFGRSESAASGDRRTGGRTASRRPARCTTSSSEAPPVPHPPLRGLMQCAASGLLPQRGLPFPAIFAQDPARVGIQTSRAVLKLAKLISQSQ